MGHFGDISPSHSLGSVWKKLNLTQQMLAFTNQKKCTTTQKKHKKNTWEATLSTPKVVLCVSWPATGIAAPNL